MSGSDESTADDEQASGAVPVRFSDLRLEPDATRTEPRSFSPGEPPEPFAHAEPRCQRIVGRALAFCGDVLDAEIARTVDPLRDRHGDPDRVLLARFDEVAGELPAARSATAEQRMLIGAYFTQEFAFESTALFSPSIVRHPDQGGFPGHHARGRRRQELQPGRGAPRQGRFVARDRADRRAIAPGDERGGYVPT